MRRITLLIILISGLLFAEEAKKDTTVTRLKPADITYYNFQYESPAEETEKLAHAKPFAIIQPNDKWFSKDKWMHFTSAYFLTVQSSYALDNMFLVPPSDSRKIAVGISLGFSLGKEFYDVYDKKGIFSWKDLFYDIAGAGLGYLTTLAIQK